MPETIHPPGPRPGLAPAVALALTAALASCGEPAALAADPPGPGAGPAAALVAAAEGEPLRGLLAEVLAGNPELAGLRAAALAAAERAPQARALPDPMVEVTWYAMPPETRVGPQLGTVRLAQELPWSGKRGLAERRAAFEAEAAAARAEAAAVEVVTEARRLAAEVAFHHHHEALLAAERDVLVHYEELARARYASGEGLDQTVVRLQAEITALDARILEVAADRLAHVADLNALRGVPGDADLPPVTVPPEPPAAADLDRLRRTALARRPEIQAADAVVRAAEAGVELARKEFRPDFTVGLMVGLTGRREDAAGRADPPEGDGEDDLGITAGVAVPLRRRWREAAVAEAVAEQARAREERRAAAAVVERELSALAGRLPFLRDRLRLFATVLTVQADESLASAEAAYSAGALSALDLLDAERVRLEVRLEAARAGADLAIAAAELEGALAAPLAAAEGALP
jgi:outer membrane protein TolC